MRPVPGKGLTLFLGAVLACGCRAGGCVAASFGDVVGATGDAHCDRRFVESPESQRAPFCQEILDTLASGEFEDDCRGNHKASAGDGPCGREHIIAGCKLLKVNDDGSEVRDWFYDVNDVLSTTGPTAGPDGGPTFEEAPGSKEDVRRLCADKSRYEEGAEFLEP